MVTPRSKLPTQSTPTRARKTKIATATAVAVVGQKMGWTFLTNHAHVVILLARNSSLVLREVALQVGITERAVQRIIADLEYAGYIEREKVGRKNRYRILSSLPLRHPIEGHRTVGDLIALGKIDP